MGKNIAEKRLNVKSYMVTFGNSYQGVGCLLQQVPTTVLVQGLMVSVPVLVDLVPIPAALGSLQRGNTPRLHKPSLEGEKRKCEHTKLMHLNTQ